MPDGDFSFKSLPKKEQEKIDQEKRRISKASKKAFESTAACLASQQFTKYREEYQQGREDLIQAGIDLEYTNPIAYSMAAQSIFMRIHLLGKLEDFVQRDIKKGK